MAAFRSHLTALGRCSGGLESQGPALTLLPEGGNENSPGWSPPQRTEPWEGSQATRRAPRRAGRISPPHVARIVFDAMFLQEREELRLEIASSMMFFLARNVRNRCAHLRPANRERSVPLLPIEAFFCSVWCIQRDAALLISRIAFAIGTDDGRESRIWT